MCRMRTGCDLVWRQRAAPRAAVVLPHALQVVGVLPHSQGLVAQHGRCQYAAWPTRLRKPACQPITMVFASLTRMSQINEAAKQVLRAQQRSLLNGRELCGRSAVQAGS